MPLGYMQLWGTSEELHYAYSTNFRAVRTHPWCNIDTVLVQHGAFMQLLAGQHKIFSWCLFLLMTFHCFWSGCWYP